MDYLVYIFYPLLLLLLFFGCKFFGKGQWNDGFLSLKQSKAVQGFCAVCIMFHHMAQKTCAPWNNPDYIVHGLDFFVYIGFLFVAVFFFCSGYGLYKSYKSKENYLQGFLGKHIWPLVIAMLTIGCVFLAGRSWVQEDFYTPALFVIGEPQQINPYGWFPLALIVFYFGFYVSFKNCKKEKWAIVFTSLFVLLYILYCDYTLFGTWWYNSVIAFSLGLVIAKNEEAVVEFAKKRYVLLLISFIVLTAGFFAISMIDHNKVNRFVILIAQMLSSCCFVISLLLIGMKVRIGNKALNFLGGFTLELYLLHGIFVQLFGYCFITEKSLSSLYIPNVFLYVLVVLVLAIPLSWGFHFLDGVIYNWFSDKKRETFRKFLKKEFKKWGIGIGILLVVTIVITFVLGRKTSKSSALLCEQYRNENITMIDVGGKKMAAYVNGEGPNTIVFMDQSSPTMVLKGIANWFADENKIVIIDPLGTGFSDDPDTPRTTENIVTEFHTALHSLNLEGPFVFVTHGFTGIYTQYYSWAYPEDVKGIIAYDNYLAEEFNDSLRARDINEAEYKRQSKRVAQERYFLQRVAGITGFYRWQWPIYESAFEYGYDDNDFLVMEELFKNTFFNKASVDEQIHEYENYYSVYGKGFPDEIPVCLCVSSATDMAHIFYGDWLEYHRNQLSDNPLSELHYIQGDLNSYYYNIRLTTQFIKHFVKVLNGEAEPDSYKGN